MAEPSPNIGPVREFIGGEKPQYDTLADLRVDMEAIDVSIVGLLLARAELVRQAAVFKQDLGESTAPVRQATNIATAVRLAEAANSRLPGFPQIVGLVYGHLVTASVAAQHQVLARTYIKGEGHQFEPEIWDLGGIPNYRQNVITRWERKIA